MLSFPSDIRLRIVGGIRSSAGNNFFTFAPPSLELTGGSAELALFFNDELLLRHQAEALSTCLMTLQWRSVSTIEARIGPVYIAKTVFVSHG